MNGRVIYYLSQLTYVISKQKCCPAVIIFQLRLRLICTRGLQQSEHDCHMHCKRGEAGVIIADLLTSACPKARHTRPPCAARNSGTIAQ